MYQWIEMPRRTARRRKECSALERGIECKRTKKGSKVVKTSKVGGQSFCGAITKRDQWRSSFDTWRLWRRQRGQESAKVDDRNTLKSNV